MKKRVGGNRMEAVDKDDFLKTFCDEEKQGRHLLSGASRVEGKWFAYVCVCPFDFLFGWLVSGRRNLSMISQGARASGEAEESGRFRENDRAQLQGWQELQSREYGSLAMEVEEAVKGTRRSWTGSTGRGQV